MKLLQKSWQVRERPWDVTVPLLWPSPFPAIVISRMWFCLQLFVHFTVIGLVKIRPLYYYVWHINVWAQGNTQNTLIRSLVLVCAKQVSCMIQTRDTGCQCGGITTYCYAFAVRCSFLYTEWKAVSYTLKRLLLVFVFRDHVHAFLGQKLPMPSQ
jgi:hypothetical protein